jgi:hypothetical protein
MAHPAAHGVFGHFVAFLFLAAVAIAAAAMGANRRRTENSNSTLELKLLADRLGFTGFDPGPNLEFVYGWEFLSCLSQGELRSASNILDGTYHDQKLFVFDFQFLIRSGKDGSMGTIRY